MLKHMITLDYNISVYIISLQEAPIQCSIILINFLV